VHFARLANTLLKDEERALEQNSMLSPTQWLSSVAVMKRTSLFFRTLCRSAKVIRYPHPASKFSPRISAIPMTRPDCMGLGLAAGAPRHAARGYATAHAHG